MAEQKIYYSIRRTPEGAACAVFTADDDDGGDLSLLATLDVSMLLTYRDHEPPLPILNECLDRIVAAVKDDPRSIRTCDDRDVPF